MATQRPKTENLYLDQVTLQGVLNLDYTLRLFIENEELELQTQDNRTWTPTKRLGLSPTSVMRAEIRMRSGKFLWAKNRQTRGVINVQRLFKDHWKTNENEVTVPMDITLDGKHHQYHWLLELRFSAITTTEALWSLLRQLGRLVEERYCQPFGASAEGAVSKVIKYGAVFAELNPIAKAVFSVASITFELFHEQTEIPFGLLDRLVRLLPLVSIVAEEIVCNEEGYLGRVISQMLEVIYRIARVSCDYVKYSGMEGGQDYLMAIEGMDGELAKVIEELVRAVDLEAVRFTERGHRSLRARPSKPQTPKNILEVLERLR